MKVAAVTPFLVDPGYGKNWLFVKVDVSRAVADPHLTGRRAAGGGYRARGTEIAVNPFRVEQGYLAVPTAPGLGIELREDVLARYAYREFPARTMPTPGDEGP